MDHITIQPGKVRGQGNVLDKKTNEDYERYNCVIEPDENNEEVLQLIPIFFDLMVSETSSNYTGKTVFYAGDHLKLSASVSYSNNYAIDERVSNQPLKLYDGDELIFTRNTDGEGIWDSDWREVTLSEGVHNFRLKFKESWSQIFPVIIKKGIGAISLSSNKSEAYVNENITWTASVTDTNGNPYIGEEVIFTDGGRDYATVVTDNEGKATFTYTHSGVVSLSGYVTIPLYAKIGTKISNTCNAKYWDHSVQSITCTRLNQILINSTAEIEVTCYDHFNNVVSGDNISICVDGINSNEYAVSLSSFTHNTEDLYVIEYTPASGGSKSLKIYRCGYPNIFTTLNVTVVVPVDGITLSSDKNILSYVDNEYAVLSAQLTGNGSPVNVSGETVTFEVRKTSDDSLVETLSGTTNSSGIASVSYYGQGTGNLYIKAKQGSSIISSEIYVKDAYYANTGTTDKTSDFDLSKLWISKNSSTGTITFINDNGWIQATRTGGGQYAFIPISKLTGLNRAFKMSMIIDYTGSDTTAYTGLYAENYQCGMFQWNPFRIVEIHTGSSDGWSAQHSDTGVYGLVFKYELEFNGRTVTHSAYGLDGTLIRSQSWTMPTNLDNTSHSVRYGVILEYDKKIRFKDLIVELL